ncbi:tetratricopeptide repeat protein [candidate division KSB1 bacterium]|nr:tetratricopeptide repeat protein [candidate division KSB1 bacterium]
MRKFIIGLSVLMMSAFGWSQSIEKILSEKELSTIQERVDVYLRDHPNATGILYLKALVEPDAEKAIQQYRQLIAKYPDCAYVDDARFRIAQYHYARSLYGIARRQFQELIHTHPGSSLKDDAAYFAAQCLFALNDNTNAYRELETFIAQYPNSSLCALAREDLQAEKSLAATPGRMNRRRRDPNQNSWLSLQKSTIDESNKQTAPTETNQSAKDDAKFTLQIGAFSSRTNAVNQKKYFTDKGYSATLSTKYLNGKTYYVVYLNKFKTRESAALLGEKLKSDYRVQYVIVQLP